MISISDVFNIIQEVAEKRDAERKSIKENSGWLVQFCPCGHVLEMKHNHPWIDKAKQRHQIDALTKGQKDCPVCNPDHNLVGYYKNF